jgi:HPt (histidine-containing phosphotransfer) domain-containing protein
MSRALLYLPGRDQVYSRVLRQFCNNYGQGVPGLDTALDASDWAAAQRQLHALRGACGAVGATIVQAEAQALELQLRSLGPSGVAGDRPPTAQALHTRLARLVAAVRDRLAAADLAAAPVAPGDAAARPLSDALQALADQLRQGDFQAGQTYRQLEPALRAKLGTAAALRLSQPLQQHDHAAALVQCQALLGQLPSPGQ